MASKKNSVLGSLVVGPVLIIGSILALWQNEGRFDYYKAASDATVVNSPGAAAPGSTIAFSGQLDTGFSLPDLYVNPVQGYLVIDRLAEIYSWTKEHDKDRGDQWVLNWHHTMTPNERNTGVKQRLSSATLYPDHYTLGGMTINPDHIHFVDDFVQIDPSTLELSEKGRDLDLEKWEEYLYLLKVSGQFTLGDERLSYKGIPVAATATYFGVLEGGRGVGKQIVNRSGLIASIIQDDGILHHLVKGDRATALATMENYFDSLKWRVRYFGVAGIVIGINLILGIFTGLFYAIPFIGRMVGTAVFLLSVAVGVPLGVLVILCSMLFHNLLTLLAPLLLVAGAFWWLRHRSKVSKANAQRLLEARLAAASPSVAPLPSRAASAPANNPGAGADAVQPAAFAAGGALPVAPSSVPDAGAVMVVEQTFRSLVVMALAEGGLDKRENRYLLNWGSSQGLSSERMKTLFAEAKTQPDAKVASKSDLELLLCMAMADGVLSSKELSLVTRLGEQLGLSSADLRGMILQVEQGNLAPA